MVDYPTKYYTGVGSRSTPKKYLQLMTKYAKRLALFGFTLRSGGAEGADTYFEKGAVKTEIYLPWHGFNNHKSELYNPSKDAYYIASQIHPAWDKCKPSVKSLHARNIHQVLGKDLDNPSDFVVYWAKENRGNVQGGTRTTVELARRENIDTYNLGIESDHTLFKKKLNKLYLNHIVTSLRHMYLFYKEGIEDSDEQEIGELLDKDNLDNSDMKTLHEHFKHYKDLNKDPRFLPTEIENLYN